MGGFIRRIDDPRYWVDDPAWGRVFDLSRYLADRHWPNPLRINGRAYRRRVRRRRR